MQLHELQPKTKFAKARRVGRGGKRGKTSGRGMKGQKARSGHSLRPEVRDTIKKLPKLRGHGKNRARTINDATVKPMVVNISMLEARYEAGEQVSPKSLGARGVITVSKGAKKSPVKVLGTGTLTKKLTISGCAVSASAREAIEKAGGTILE